MNKTFALLVILLTVVVPTFGGDRSPVAQIALYPYYHDEETAWRVTVFADGRIRYEESAHAFKYPGVVDSVEWIQVSSSLPDHLSRSKINALLLQLERLKLAGLRSEYSAQHSYIDPRGDREEVADSGQERVISAETTRVVTHGATYRFQMHLEGLAVNCSVYAPSSALGYEDPPHPDRAQIAKLVSAWYHVLRAVGPVNDLNAKTVRRWMK